MFRQPLPFALGLVLFTFIQHLPVGAQTLSESSLRDIVQQIAPQAAAEAAQIATQRSQCLASDPSSDCLARSKTDAERNSCHLNELIAFDRCLDSANERIDALSARYPDEAKALDRFFQCSFEHSDSLNRCISEAAKR